MIFDADILGYFMNGGDNKEKGKIAYAAFAANPAADGADAERLDLVARHVELLASRRTPPGTSCNGRRRPSMTCSAPRKMDFVNPVRASVWKDEVFRERIDKSYPGYLEQHDVSAPGAKIYFTAAAAVLRPHHRMGGDAAEDGGQGSAGRRRASTSSPQSIDKQLKEAGLG